VVNQCRLLNGIIKRLFHDNLVHTNHLHQVNRKPEITHNSYVLSMSHLSSSQVRHLDTLEILDNRYSHNWPFLFLEENPLSHAN
jgi:hypothetical protein